MGGDILRVFLLGAAGRTILILNSCPKNLFHNYQCFVACLNILRWKINSRETSHSYSKKKSTLATILTNKTYSLAMCIVLLATLWSIRDRATTCKYFSRKTAYKILYACIQNNQEAFYLGQNLSLQNATVMFPSNELNRWVYIYCTIRNNALI